MASLIGQHLGQYEVIALLGSGGMASVYRARQSRVGRDVAIKIIRPDRADTVDFAQRFEREARLIASLSHPNIVKLFDYGREAHIVYLVMELVSGGSLEQKIKAGPLTLTTVERVLAQLASALDYAHKEGVLHRDLKPSNVLLDAHGNAVLTDFGIAKLLNESTSVTKDGQLVGTPTYMAPELWHGGAATAQADVYALGAILFEMLTGRPPFTGKTLHSLMYQHLENPLPSVLNMQPDLPPEIDMFMQHTLNKHMEERYKNPLALSEDFRSLLRGEQLSDVGSGSASSVGASVVKDSEDQPTVIGIDSKVLGPVDTVRLKPNFPTAVTSDSPRRPVIVRYLAVMSALTTLGIGSITAFQLLRAGTINTPIALVIELVTITVFLPLGLLFLKRPVSRRAGISLLIFQMFLLTTLWLERTPFLNAYIDNLGLQSEQAALAVQTTLSTDLLKTIARLSPEQVHRLLGEFNDQGIESLSHNDFVHAHAYLEAVQTIDADEAINVARTLPEKSVSRYNLAFLRDVEGNLSGAIVAYREAIQLDDANFKARYLSRISDEIGRFFYSYELSEEIGSGN